MSHTKPRAPASPVDLLNTDLSRLYTHLHPVLLLSLYAFRFRAIVADPVAALTSTLLPLAALQMAYAALCLPPMGARGSTGSQPEKPKVGEKKRAAAASKGERGISGMIMPAFLSLLASALVATPLFTAALVLFGAPVTSHHWHTLLAAAHMALLSALPLVYVYGVHGETWRHIVALLLPVDELHGGLIGTGLGAWLGAIPIPLDWDREWQKWPVTIVTGAYIGSVVGKLVGGTLLKGKGHQS